MITVNCPLSGWWLPFLPNDPLAQGPMAVIVYNSMGLSLCPLVELFPLLELELLTCRGQSCMDRKHQCLTRKAMGVTWEWEQAEPLLLSPLGSWTHLFFPPKTQHSIKFFDSECILHTSILIKYYLQASMLSTPLIGCSNALLGH